MTQLELCGRLVWFSVTGVDVRHDTLATAMTDLGLDLGLLPRKARAAEAFRRACRESSTRYPLADGAWAEIQVKGLGTGTERLQGQLVRTITPVKGAIYHDSVGEVIFVLAAKDDHRRRATTGEKLQLRLDYERLADYERVPLEQLCERLRRRYAHGRDHLAPSAVRDTLRSLLEHAHALRCSPTGALYFLADRHQPRLRAVERLCGRLGVLLRSVPLVDAPEVRTTLAATLHEQALYQAQLLAESFAADVASRGKLIASTRQKYGARTERLLAGLDEHARLLGVALPEQVADTLAPVLERLAATE